MLSCVLLFATPWTAACQASLSFTISQSLPKIHIIEPVMPLNHVILCHPLSPAFCKYTPLKKKSQMLSMCVMRPDLGAQFKHLASSSNVKAVVPAESDSHPPSPSLTSVLLSMWAACTPNPRHPDLGQQTTSFPTDHISPSAGGASKWEDVAHEPSLGFLSKTISIFPIYLPLPLLMACHFQD